MSRSDRKAIVFHIMYGTFPGATVDEMKDWRLLCAEYINGVSNIIPPLSLAGFRRWAQS